MAALISQAGQGSKEVAPITHAEIMEALKKQKNGKAPGPDGLPAEYYKEPEEVLFQPFKKLLEYVEEEGKLPATWTEATISLIHKENTEGKEIQNYRPISLLNVDYKIYATILATRMKRILIHLIHQDQSGFLPKRHMKNNIRIVLNSLEYYEAHPEKQMAMIFLDAEKAFDNLDWNFLLYTLETLQVGKDF